MIMAFTLKSQAFSSGETIPKEFTGEGEDRSPSLEWSDVPPGTREFALICEDPDAPRAEPWVHWVLYKIPPNVTKLAHGIPAKERLDLPPGALQGTNSFGNVGYGGPMPPEGHGPHRYFFRLLALDCEVAESADMTKDELLAAVEGHVIGSAEMMGRFERARGARKLKLVA
jgi:Raf kinase inhibitor-like YbhB/YbcL family protein